MVLKRRHFLGLCVEGSLVGLVACVPDGRFTMKSGRTGQSQEGASVLDAGHLPATTPPPHDAGQVAHDAGHRAPDAQPRTDSGAVPRDSGTPIDAGHADSGAADSGVHPDAAPADTGAPHDAGCIETVTMYDMNAQALYYDGTHGPLTGTITVDMVIADEDVTLEFWHGHGGQQHMFTVTRTHFAQLKQGQRVTVETSTVDSHEHTLFIDPVDPQWRVPGAQPVEVPNC